MIDKNKAPNHLPDGVMIAPVQKCRECKSVLTKNNKVPHYAYIGFQKACKDCLNAKSLKTSRKKSKILKDNPLW